MLIPKLSALFETSLASALSAAGTSFTVVSATDRDGNALSGLYGFIIDEGSADEEFVIGTVSGTTVTISYRGIDADAPNTEVSNNKKAHRRGASVKISDYPILGVLRNILNGDESLPNPIKYATGVGPVSADDLVDKAYADALPSGGTLSYDRIIVSGKAGETVASGQLVYLKASDNRWWLCDADTAATVENIQLGIAQGAGTAGNAISGGVLVFGVASNLTGLVADTKYYASNTAGALSTSAGTTEVTVGLSISTTSLLFAPRYDQQITEDIQDALAGTSGTPSNSNKYVTDADTSTTSSNSKVPRSDSSGKVSPTWLDYEAVGLGFLMGPSAHTHVKTYRNFQVPMIGTSAAAVQGAFVASSADVTFNASAASIGGTGADRVYYDDVFPVFDPSNTSVRFNSSNIIIMDYWAILPTSSVDTMFGFCDAASGLTITYNQTAQEALCFTTNNGSLYAHVGTGAASTTTAIAGVTVSTVHNYRIVADLGADTAYFYVDGILKQTISTNFPTSTSAVDVIMGRSADGSTYFSNPLFSIEMNP